MIFAVILALLVVAFVVHTFYAIEKAYWQRTAIRCAISLHDPREAIRKLGVFKSISFSDHVSFVIWFRDPSVLYAELPDEVERVW